MRLYQGGPMRGHVNYNFQAFEDGLLYLEDLGHEVVSPHDIDMSSGWVHLKWLRTDYTHGSDDAARFVYENVELTDKFDFDAAIRADIAAMMRCDAVSFLPGWRNSEGCLIEDQVRQLVRLPRYEHGQSADGTWWFRPSTVNN